MVSISLLLKCVLLWRGRGVSEHRRQGGRSKGDKLGQRTFVRGGCTPFLRGRFLSEHNLMHRDVIAQFQLIKIETGVP